MKKRVLAGFLSATLLLSGCASLLKRSYTHVVPHSIAPITEDGSALRAESYQELVNYLMYLINQGADRAAILMLDGIDVNRDLDAACTEVVQQSPLGAYAVDYIKYSTEPILSHYQANIKINYRRTRKQIASLVSVTGTTSIHTELSEALMSFTPELTLFVNNFEGDEASIRTLCRQTYLDTPAAALEMPDFELSLYPDQGTERIVEIRFNKDPDVVEGARRQNRLRNRANELWQGLRGLYGDAYFSALCSAILNAGGYLPGGGSTAYDALCGDGANSQGLALATALLCQRSDIRCVPVDGQKNGEPHLWTVVNTAKGWRHLDLTLLDSSSDSQTAPLLTDAEMHALGYHWDTELIPVCSSAPPF